MCVCVYTHIQERRFRFHPSYLFPFEQQLTQDTE